MKKIQLVASFIILFLMCILYKSGYTNMSNFMLIFIILILIFYKYIHKDVIFFILFTLSTLHIVRITLFGFKLYLNQIFVIGLIIIQILKWAFKKEALKVDRRAFKIYILLLIFLLINCFFNIYNNVPFRFIRMTIWLTLSIIESLLVYMNNVNYEPIYKSYVLSGVFEAILIFCDYLVLGNTIGEGMMLEPNIASSFLASIVFVILAEIIKSHKTKEQLILIIELLIIIAGVIFSVTRTSIIALVVILPIFIILMAKYEGFKFRKVVVMILCLLVSLIIVYQFSNVNNLSSYKLQNMTNLKEGNGYLRIIMIKQAFNDVSENILLGRGTCSFGLYHYYDSHVSGLENFEAYLPNLFVATLFDTGLVGLLLLIIIFVLVIRYSYNKIRKNKCQNNILIGFLCGFVVLLICFNTTSAVWYSSFWNYISIILILIKGQEQ